MYSGDAGIPRNVNAHTHTHAHTHTTAAARDGAGKVLLKQELRNRPCDRAGARVSEKVAMNLIHDLLYGGDE